VGAVCHSVLAARGRVLEIAHGPGHLNLSLRQAGFNVVGIDRSPEMCQMLRARLARASSRSEAGDGSGLRASALRLPFADGAFDAAVSTFPAEFLFMPGTLAGVKRVLQPGGRFVIVPGTRLRGNSPLTHLVRLAYTLTGQGETPAPAVAGLFASAGFAFEEHLVARPHADVIVWVCTTPFMPRRAPSGR